MARSRATARKAKAKKGAEPVATNGNSKKDKPIDLDAKSEDDSEPEQIEATSAAEANGSAHQEDNSPPSDTKSSLLSECEKHFGTNDLYTVLNLNKSTADSVQIKKAYYKLSLKYHPDKASEEAMKEESKIKFQVLCQVYSILSDSDKKKIYDESGLIDGETDLFTSSKDWNEYWRALFKKITKEDVDKFFADYKDSAEERTDLLRLYEKHKGDMNLIMQEMISSDDLENEPRFRSIILEAIEQGQAVSHSQFVNESKRKAAKRKNDQAREAKEAEEIKKKMNVELESEESLKTAILSRRKKENDNFLDKLAEKYSVPAKKAKGKASSKHVDEDEEDETEEEEEEEDDDDDDFDDRKKRPSKKKVVGKRASTTASGAKKAKKIKRL